MSRLDTFLLVVFLFVITAIAGHSDFEDAKREEARYCAAVADYKRSNGTMGHPPYDGDEFCAKYDTASSSHSLP